jgi:hypothetical protein
VIAPILPCSQLFSIGYSIIGLVIHEVVMGTNNIFKKLIMGFINNKMQVVMMNFKSLCCMHNVMGVIDGIHICITNPIGGFWEDYY